MRPDRTQIFKGMVMHGGPGPTAPPPFSRRDTITKGMSLVADSGGPVLLAKAAPALPDLTPIGQRIDALQKKIEAAAAELRKRTH